MNLYDFIEDCKANGLSAEEAANEWVKYCAEMEREFLDRYYDDPMVNDGWVQQDMIDLRRREQ